MIEAIEAKALSIVSNINAYLSNYILVFLLVSVGLWYTIRTHFVQFRCFGESIKRIFSDSRSRKAGTDAGIVNTNEGMTSFQALATAMASQVGTGNIVGASGAILAGGPGAIFWMWFIAFLGMATIYAEATLAIKTRNVVSDGIFLGGPVYYIRTAFTGKAGKIMAAFFAVACILALGYTGCMVQANSIGCIFHNAFNIPTWVIGIALVTVCGLIFIGGAKRLASINEKMVPFMAILFLTGCVIVLICRIKYLPESFFLIFKYAFDPQAIIGGSFGIAIKTAVSEGAKRGLFSNEAGMGSTPHAHAQANVKDPHDQGVAAILGVFIDTFVLLTMNAIVIISTLYAGNGPLSGGYTGSITEALNKTNLVQVAFGTIFGEIPGSMFVAVCLFFFAFSTILSWNLFGKINAIYVFDQKNNKRSVRIYTVTSMLFILTGTLLSNDFVWELSDFFNNMMVIPNVMALFSLTGIVTASLKNSVSKQ